MDAADIGANVARVIYSGLPDSRHFVDVHHWAEGLFQDIPSDRHFTNRWHVAIFQPAGRVESWLRGYAVEVKHVDDTHYERILALPSIGSP